MILKKSNWRDIQKYYEDTYIKIQEEGENILYVQKITSEGVRLINITEEEIYIHLRDDSPYDLTFSLPHKTLYQVDNHCWSMSRRPMKQYQRGICTHNIAIHVLANGSWLKKDVSFDNLAPFVTKQPYITLTMAMKNKKYRSLALSSRFSVDISAGLVFCDLFRIGVFRKADRSFDIFPLFVADIQHILSEMGEADSFTVKEFKQ